jgi:leader peptidase (prepilin peptidase)/N-methyltransferase
MDSWLVVLGFVVGAAVGSFLNMLIYRLPRRISFVNPAHSICPTCNHTLKSVDLIPILSWLSTKGKCRYCHEPVSSRYFWVEVITGVLFAAVWWNKAIDPLFPDWVGMWAQWTMIACLVAVIFIDWELYIIPDELNAALLVVAIAYHAATGSLGTALTGALLGWGLLWGIAFFGRIAFGKDAMGDGDVKMMRGVGAFLGPLLLGANLAIAVLLGIIGGVLGIILAKKLESPSSSESSENADASVMTPTPIGFIVLSGAWYLFCLDIVSLAVPALNRWISTKIPQEIVEEEENWKPSLTTIPFGPYLAAGAIICMIGGGPIEGAIRNYWEHATGSASDSSATSPAQTRS